MIRMRFILILVLLLFTIIFLSSCVNNHSYTAESREGEETGKQETGHPNGQVQIECIYYNGVVWMYDMYNSDLQKLKELPLDATFIGETLEENSYDIPNQNFYTSHINPGKRVFITQLGEAIYIELKQGIYFRFIPVNSIS